MTVNEIKESFKNLSDEDLTSLKHTIHDEQNKRRSVKIKTAFEAFEDAATNLDKMLDTYYDIAGEDYTMEGIVNAIEYSIQMAGYDI